MPQRVDSLERTMAQIERTNVQGLIFRSYNYRHTRHFLLNFDDATGARRFFTEWVPHVTNAARDLDAKPDPLINIALSWFGLKKIGAVDDGDGIHPASDAFPGDFRDPPDAKAMRDYGDSAPTNWWNGRFRSEDVDFVLLLYCQSEASLSSSTAAIRSSAVACGLRELIPSRDGQEALTGYLANQGITHFGYRDGISQPQVNWDDMPNAPELVDLRHFILGYGTPEIESVPTQQPWSDLVRDGSYLILRWIYQDVAKFNKFLRERSASLWPQMPAEEAQELLAAKMMGRWRNGTPLVLSPDEPKPEMAARNDFSYAMDPDGFKCPFSSHIRIVNRRDDELTFPNARMFPRGTPRVMRRGSSYGTHLDGEIDDGHDRGLIGIFLCTNINLQFFTLMRWINETEFAEKVTNFHGQDALFGNRSMPERSDTFEFQAKGEKRTLTNLQDFIRTQGTLILLLPGVATLKQLCDRR
jgi:deferrochelatase/peroxidase EfeB